VTTFADVNGRYPYREVIPVREFDKEGPRAEGSPVVWAGREEGPALVVVDPTGAARHDQLPATWERLADHFQVAWCRIPASKRSVEDVEDVFETLAERRATATLVASGSACDSALALARQYGDIVTSVLLVDPPADSQALADSDIEVRVVARSHPGPTDRVEPPMPLGHPEVVEGLTTALASMG
jgi:pimeloyl-ACP methyl ester carboxylesterase